MRRRRLFGLAAGAVAGIPVSAVAAPMVEMHPNDVAWVPRAKRVKRSAKADFGLQYRQEFIRAFEERAPSLRTGDHVVINGRLHTIAADSTAEDYDDA